MLLYNVEASTSRAERKSDVQGDQHASQKKVKSEEEEKDETEKEETSKKMKKLVKRLTRKVGEEFLSCLLIYEVIKKICPIFQSFYGTYGKTTRRGCPCSVMATTTDSHAGGPGSNPGAAPPKFGAQTPPYPAPGRKDVSRSLPHKRGHMGCWTLKAKHPGRQKKPHENHTNPRKPSVFIKNYFANNLEQSNQKMPLCKTGAGGHGVHLAGRVALLPV